MIPQTIELKNFLSYGEQLQRIDFRDHSLICFSGKNGNGKSALLDAITWALWGQARKITGSVKPDEGLLRLGQTRMMVCLEFMFADRLYRVRREFTKSYGKPLAALDFELFDPATERFISLTDKTIRATQLKIDNLLGLDFDTFINSAFLRQGQSNEFSKKSSKERKQILATILGLAKYDILQQHALEKVRAIQDNKKALAMVIEQCAQELATQEAVTAKLNEATTGLALAVTTLQTLEHSHEALQHNLRACKASQQMLQSLHATCDTKKNSLLQGITALRELITTWRRTHAYALSLPNMQALHEQKAALFVQEQQFFQVQQKNVALQGRALATKEAYNKQLAVVTSAYDTRRNTLRLQMQQKELQLAHHQKVRADKNSTKISLFDTLGLMDKQRQELEAIMRTSDAFMERFNATKAQFEKRRAFYQVLVQRGNWVKNELQELEHKQAVVQDTANPSCPLCEQLLTVTRKKFLAEHFTGREVFLRKRLLRISQLLKNLKDILFIQHQDVQSLTKESDTYTQQAARLQELYKRIEEHQKQLTIITQDITVLSEEEEIFALAVASAHKEIIQLEAGHQQMQADDTALKQLANELTVLEAEKNASLYDHAAYQQLQEQQKNVNTQLTRYESFQHELARQQERMYTIQGQCKSLKLLKAEIAQLETAMSTLSGLDQQATLLGNQISVLQVELQQAVTHKESFLHSIGSLEYELKRLQKRKEEQAASQQSLAKVLQEIEDYQMLSAAFSKNGIQALLIEEAIPEIEHEANIILSRLTNNQAQIFIESLRDLKSGGVKETLDIQIADMAGIRPYEMYSGGEAFRVDFALRIAISKLLARRAGTALQTLIIDEGFGSQDEDGLAYIMEALYAIQNDFSKIIIVSHLSEFKHNFPVHYVIEKGPLGSTVRIEERG